MKSTHLIITTGDPDGIGLGVTFKAIKKYRRPRGQRVLIFVSSNSETRFLRALKKIVVDQFSGLEEAYRESQRGKPGLYLIVSKDPAAHWIVDAGKLCLANPKTCALVTAPLSKGLIRAASFSGLGHTEILADSSGVPRKSLFMGFIGTKFSVVLATGHVPVSRIERDLTVPRLKAALLAAAGLRRSLPKASRRLPIGILGLNPHAGDGGLIADFERRQLAAIIRWAAFQGIPVQGPLVPDAAFLPLSTRRYSVFVALYHDQGLIPFKALHGADSGVHVTLGLPFVRTSVDHGTAKDIFGKNRAAFGSMVDALVFANKFLGVRK